MRMLCIVCPTAPLPTPCIDPTIISTARLIHCLSVALCVCVCVWASVRGCVCLFVLVFDRDVGAGMPDVERLTRKLERRKASLSDLCQLYRASSKLPMIQNALLDHPGPHAALLKTRSVPSISSQFSISYSFLHLSGTHVHRPQTSTLA